jgi:hypothetical protein
MISAVPLDAVDWEGLGRGHRHTVSRGWLDVARGRLAGSEAFSLSDNGDMRVVMMGRLVEAITANPWTDPYLRAAEHLGDEDFFPALAFMYPNYDAFPIGPGAHDSETLHRFVDGVCRMARERAARTVVFQYLGPESRDLTTVLAASGFDVFPAAHRAELPVRWGGLAGYLESFPTRRRNKLKYEIRAMSASGLRFETRGLPPDDDELVTLRRALMVKYGSPDDPERERRWFDRVRACFPAQDVYVVVARDDTRAVAFTLFVRTGDTLTALLTGADYGSPTAQYVYFGTCFYAAVQLAADLGTRTIEYGMGAEQAKRARGCTLVPLRWAVRGVGGTRPGSRTAAGERSGAACR